ncbi:CLUMA_CG006671, isoform A [Clunio marinus]|uniref:CLUMA_CG006671, isoform A n=1 Tax=Clunio marinus TaxID=568069 RepID=A0A1J1I0F6_9DIPT|nr:CLUMA_CG006671, isoform A [Clunio marinus]
MALKLKNLNRTKELLKKKLSECQHQMTSELYGESKKERNRRIRRRKISIESKLKPTQASVNAWAMQQLLSYNFLSKARH